MARVSEIGAVLAVAAVFAGCEDRPKESASTSASASASASDAPTPVGSHVAPLPSASARAALSQAPPRGPGGVLFEAAKSLTLDDAQKTKVNDAMKALMNVDRATESEAKRAVAALRTALATQLKAGTVDNAKLAPSYDAIEKSLGAAQTKDAEAVNALHAALTPEQRKAVAADLRAKQAMLDEKMATMNAAAGKRPEDRKPGAESSPAARELAWLTGDLGLDEAQQKRVDALVVSSEPNVKDSNKRFEDLAKDFAQDGFDAKKSALFKSKSIRDSLEERSKTLDKISKVLKPEQREKLALKIEDAAPAPGMGAPPGMGAMGGPGGRGPMGGGHDGHGH